MDKKIKTTRQQRQRLKTESRKRPRRLTAVPESMWPTNDVDPKRVMVLVSQDYLVQVFTERGAIRLSVNRTEMLPSGRWDDRLSWDELQEIKRQAGYGDHYAVEVYPRDQDIVNVANMRHLWILPDPLPIGWVSEYVKTNREKSQTPKHGKYWCMKCDRALVAVGGKCPACKAKSPSKAMKHEKSQ